LPPIRTEGPPDRSDPTGGTPPRDADPSQGKATVTSPGRPGVSTDDVGRGTTIPPPLPYPPAPHPPAPPPSTQHPPTRPAPPGRNRRLPVLIAGVAVVVVAAVVAAITLTGSPAHKPKPGTASIMIAAQSSVTPVSGYTFVYYKGGNDSTAQISGKIKGAASG